MLGQAAERLPQARFQSAPGLEAGRCEMDAAVYYLSHNVSIRARP